MTTELVKDHIKTFKYEFPTCTNKEVVFKLEVPVEIPYNGSTRELVQRVIEMFKIPVYLENELNDKLLEFVRKETKQFHNNRDARLLNDLKNGDIDVEGIIKSWEKLFKENVVEYAEQKGNSDEEVFAAAYHKLVHSPALETILQVESSYAKTVSDMLKNKEEDIGKLSQRQTEEMEEKVRLLNTFTTEQDINDLAAHHFEEQSLVAGRWGSQLDALSQTQRSHYRDWIMSTLEHYQSTSALNTPSNSPLGTFSPEKPLLQAAPPPTRLEESFTIHLGSQLKQTHNLRLVALDMRELCKVEPDLSSSSSRLQTALNLYSVELSACVLLTELGPKNNRDADDVLRPFTEYHFLPHDAQLNCMVDMLKEPTEQRNAQRKKDLAENPNCTAPKVKSSRNLQTGDIYITKHSNLADVHIIFHLMVDDTLKSGDINSRHPVILGLRNILKACCTNDITTLTLPLLLKHEVSDEMTATWCVRRAELVLKCVKGFMMETSAWGGSELRALQLAVPSGLAAPLFHNLATLLPNIFRISNPVKFKASKSDS